MPSFEVSCFSVILLTDRKKDSLFLHLTFDLLVLRKESDKQKNDCNKKAAVKDDCQSAGLVTCLNLFIQLNLERAVVIAELLY